MCNPAKRPRQCQAAAVPDATADSAGPPRDILAIISVMPGLDSDVRATMVLATAKYPEGVAAFIDARPKSQESIKGMPPSMISSALSLVLFANSIPSPPAYAADAYSKYRFLSVSRIKEHIVTEGCDVPRAAVQKIAAAAFDLSEPRNRLLKALSTSELSKRRF